MERGGSSKKKGKMKIYFECGAKLPGSHVSRRRLLVYKSDGYCYYMHAGTKRVERISGINNFFSYTSIQTKQIK